MLIFVILSCFRRFYYIDAGAETKCQGLNFWKISCLRFEVVHLTSLLLCIFKYRKSWSEYNLLQKNNQGDASPNPFMFLLNGIGIFGSSVFGVLFALAQKEKDSNEATMESVSRYARYSLHQFRFRELCFKEELYVFSEMNYKELFQWIK